MKGGKGAPIGGNWKSGCGNMCKINLAWYTVTYVTKIIKSLKKNFRTTETKRKRKKKNWWRL